MIDERRFGGRNLLVEIMDDANQRFRTELLDGLAVLAFDLPQIGTLVGLPSARADIGKSQNSRTTDVRGAEQLLRLTENRRRIQPAADRHGYRMHRAEPPPDRFHKMLSEGFGVLANRLQLNRSPGIEITKTPFSEPLRLDDGNMCGRQRGDACEAGRLVIVHSTCADQHEIGQPFVIGAGLDARMREDCLDLGREDEEPIAAEVIERSQPQGIAGNHQPTMMGIVHSERKLADQVFGEPIAPSLVGADDELRIADRRRQCQPTKELGAIVQPAVEDDERVPARERLPLTHFLRCDPIVLVRETDVAHARAPFAVSSTVPQRGVHRRQRVSIQRLAIQVPDAGKPTHAAEYTLERCATRSTAAWSHMPDLLSTTVVVATADALTAEFGEELVVLNALTGVYYGLEKVGARVWALLKEPTTLGALRDAIAAEYDVRADVCEHDLAALVTSLRSVGLVDVRAAHPQG